MNVLCNIVKKCKQTKECSIEQVFLCNVLLAMVKHKVE